MPHTGNPATDRAADTANSTETGGSLTELVTGYPNLVNDLSDDVTALLSALGGTIGTGLFLASGSTIATAGPLGALIGYCIVGAMVYGISKGLLMLAIRLASYVCEHLSDSIPLAATSLGELAAYMPVSGSFNTYAGRFVDPALAFALGWNYFVQWAVSLSSELSAAGIIMAFWTPSLPSWIWSAFILVILVFIHSFGVDGFGESEYALSMVKVIAIIAFIIAGAFVDVGVLGTQPPIGFQYWSIPGAPIKDGIIGIIGVFVTAFFGFGGTELVGVTAGEAVDPQKSVPKAIKSTFWRIFLFYVVAIFVMGLVIRNDDPSLLTAAETSDITIAPFTLVFQQAGLKAAAHIMNGVILSAVISASSSAMYAASRTLMALAQASHAPAFLATVNSTGVPVYSLALTTLIGCLAFLSIIWGNGVVFTWLLSITGVSGILTWISIAVIHIRFRYAFQVQNKSLEDVPYLAPLFPILPIVAILLGLGIVAGQGYVAMTAVPFSLQNVLAVYTGIPVFAALYLGYRWRYKTQFVRLDTCDLSGGDGRPDHPTASLEHEHEPLISSRL
eukprot:jgi/Hompol1/5816/HPOL_002124-RA